MWGSEEGKNEVKCEKWKVLGFRRLKCVLDTKWHLICFFYIKKKALNVPFGLYDPWPRSWANGVISLDIFLFGCKDYKVDQGLNPLSSHFGESF